MRRGKTYNLKNASGVNLNYSILHVRDITKELTENKRLNYDGMNDNELVKIYCAFHCVNSSNAKHKPT